MTWFNTNYIPQKQNKKKKERLKTVLQKQKDKYTLTVINSTNKHMFTNTKTPARAPTSLLGALLTNVSSAVTTAPAATNNIYNENSPNKGNKNVKQQ